MRINSCKIYLLNVPLYFFKYVYLYIYTYYLVGFGYTLNKHNLNVVLSCQIFILFIFKYGKYFFLQYFPDFFI